MSLGLGLFLIGLALFFGAFIGLLIMGLFASGHRCEAMEWKNKYFTLEEKIKTWIGKYEILNKQFLSLNASYDKLLKKYNSLINKEV